jgi:hypothetical protein
MSIGPLPLTNLQKLGQELGIDFYRPSATETPSGDLPKGREAPLRQAMI